MTDALDPKLVAAALEQIAHSFENPPAPPVPDMMGMVGQLAATFIEKEEGSRLKAYQDTGGHWTIGIGHTPAVPGQVITKAQELQLFAMDLLTFGQAITPLLAVIPGVGQYVALLSLAFNIGQFAFKGSSVLRAHNAGETQTAAADFLLWDKEHVNGVLVESEALLNRRKIESAMYLKG